MIRYIRNLVAAAAAVLTLLAFVPVAAGDPALPVSEDKPFAEAYVLLQLSDADEAKQNAVLDVANNLIKHYGGPDMVDIEIVAFGPGMQLLLAGNPREERIASLVENGVRFVGCMNTVDTMERKNGTRPVLNEHTILVQTGVAHIVDRVRQGYILVRP